MTVRLFLLFVLALTLSSCASLRRQQVVFVPPKLDCGIFDPPKVATPNPPKPGERDVVLWQLDSLGWQAYAEHVLTQRLESAKCVAALREAGIVK